MCIRGVVVCGQHLELDRYARQHVALEPVPESIEHFAIASDDLAPVPLEAIEVETATSVSLRNPCAEQQFQVGIRDNRRDAVRYDVIRCLPHPVSVEAVVRILVSRNLANNLKLTVGAVRAGSLVTAL